MPPTRREWDPTEPLPNPRQEAFASAVSNGVGIAIAYAQAGYTPGDAPKRVNDLATRLIASATVQKRIAYLKGQNALAARAVATVDAQRIQQELEALALSDIGTLFEEGLNDDGGVVSRVLPITRWPKVTRAAVSSVKVKRYLEGSGDDARTVETVEFKLWNKGDALRQLREHMGLVKAPGDLSDLLNITINYAPATTPPAVEHIGAKPWAAVR